MRGGASSAQRGRGCVARSAAGQERSGVGARRRQAGARIDAEGAQRRRAADRGSLRAGPIKTLDCETAVAKPTFIFTPL